MRNRLSLHHHECTVGIDCDEIKFVGIGWRWRSVDIVSAGRRLTWAVRQNMRSGRIKLFLSALVPQAITNRGLQLHFLYWRAILAIKVCLTRECNWTSTRVIIGDFPWKFWFISICRFAHPIPNSITFLASGYLSTEVLYLWWDIEISIKHNR